MAGHRFRRRSLLLSAALVIVVVGAVIGFRLAEGVGALGRKGVEVVGETTKGIGGAIQGLFGGAKKK